MLAFLVDVTNLMDKYKHQVVAICIATEVLETRGDQFAIGHDLKIATNNKRAGFDMIKDASERTQQFRVETLAPKTGEN